MHYSWQRYMHVAETTKGIIKLLPHGFEYLIFNVDLGKIYHPEFEGESMKVDFFIAPALSVVITRLNHDPQ